MTRVSIAKPVFAVALAVMVVIFTASAKGPARQGGESNGAMSSAYGAYWQVGNGYSSTLVLRNNDHHNAASVQVTLFGSTGQQVGITQVQLAKDAVNRLDLSSLTGGQPGFGGVALGFSTGVPKVAGKVVISDSQSGASVELPVQGGYRYDTENALYAPWWMPDDGTEGRIALFNGSAQSVVVSPSISLKGTEQSANKITLAAHESEVVTLRDLGVNGQQQGAVILRYSGVPHALQPALLLENKSTGYWLGSTFNAKHGKLLAETTGWQFPDVRMGSDQQNAQDASQLETYALLTNGSGNRVSPQVTAYYGVRGEPTKTAIPVTALGPLETRLIDLTENVRSGLIPASVSQLALSASYSGQPGDLAMEIFSVDRVSSQVSKYAGTVLPPGVVDASYWNVGSNVCLLPKVENSGSVTGNGQVAAYYSTSLGIGSYLLPAVSVAGGKSRTLPLKHDLQSGIPDQNGETVPAGTGAGLLTLSGTYSNPSAASPSVIGAQCATLEACAVPPVTPTAAGAGLHLIATPSCSAPQAPSISSISPTGAPFSSDTAVTINGDNLDAPGLTVAITGGTQAKNLSCSSSTQCTATFDTGGDTTVGTQDMYLSSDYGHSNSEDFEVGDQTPTVDNITPPVWVAGTPTPLTITGSYFGTNPKVTFSDGSIAWTQTGATDTGLAHGAKITGTVTVPTCSVAEAVTVTVTSQGYNGSGFIDSTQGQSNHGTDTATVTPISAPAPTISFHGSVLSGTQSVVVGQQIVLTGNIPSPQSSCVASQTWTTPTGKPVAGYSVSQSSASVTSLSNSTSNTFTFYWTTAGTFTTTFSYGLTNGGSSPATTATFKLSAPTISSGSSTFFTATYGVKNGGGTMTNPVDVFPNGTYQILACGDPSLLGFVCIQFVPKSTAPSGGSSNAAFQWVQILSGQGSVTYKFRTIPPTSDVTCSGTTCPALDTAYPMQQDTDGSSNDSPYITLAPVGGHEPPSSVTAFGEAAEAFTARTYLMWDPAMLPYGQSGSCTPAHNTTGTPVASTCTGSIPVPVAVVSWGWGGCALNQSDNPTSTEWISECGGPTNPDPPSVSGTSAYPAWSNLATGSGGTNGLDKQ